MSQIINFEGFAHQQQNLALTNAIQDSRINSSGYTHSTDPLELTDELDKSQQLIREMFPGKLMFTIREVSSLIGTSYEFVRSAINKGRINVKHFGDRKMIHLNELCKIITYGVN